MIDEHLPSAAHSSQPPTGPVIALLLCLCVPPGLAQSTASGCGASATTHHALSHTGPLLRAIEHAPRNVIRLENLKWELPIAAATGIPIAERRPPARHSTQGRSWT